ncbi:Putative endonuclease or glycosyl hydrolase [Arabidopsis thaliana]|uniref:Endonuclease or glycosyl hydrolase n=1 Tax=Arabidopsis thaliana TaxID=3702 RepID=A0A1P8AVR8_ARATH|nr:Putative endonuclease or glycosyl hydrolase [Arabidopsis thaliana]ANM60746.1 Putative endonuclease or glycosyl hydrolase [Arabidopsis thaliana]|eukprot:NP_001323010.1 Putative endonuclease or glycosyl hydrolase [Arabidopsis thaliana]
MTSSDKSIPLESLFITFPPLSQGLGGLWLSGPGRIGYNTVRSILPDDPQQAASSASPSTGSFLWESLLASLPAADDMDSGAPQEDKCGEMGEPALLCEQCRFTVQGFENFSTHLKSEEHAHESQYYRNEDDETDGDDYVRDSEDDEEE